jgi:hypothetical protein
MDESFMTQLEIVMDHCEETGLRAGAGTIREAIREIERLEELVARMKAILGGAA